MHTVSDLASLSMQRILAMQESERRRAEAEGAMRSRDDVLGIVSHDLRNPVNTISMAASLLADADIPLTPDQQQKQLEIIQRSARRRATCDSNVR
ncbi:MAG: histidine kinase dimerization/phospho-acceptor domain-containing protein, partial [Gemmatimonadaceae bacterium]